MSDINDFNVQRLFCSAELFKLADYYGEEDLKWRCEQQLKLLTSVHNVCEVYSIAVLYSVKVSSDVVFTWKSSPISNIVRAMNFINPFNSLPGPA